MEILFPNIARWGYKLQRFSEAVPPAPKPISYLSVLQYETNCTCRQPRPPFAWILPICIIMFPVIDQCRYFFYLYKALILKRSLISSDANTKIGSKTWVWILMQLKYIFSNPGRWRFLTILVLDAKLSKLTLCFSILLL